MNSTHSASLKQPYVKSIVATFLFVVKIFNFTFIKTKVYTSFRALFIELVVIQFYYTNNLELNQYNELNYKKGKY
jgi:hypothetical protein